MTTSFSFRLSAGLVLVLSLAASATAQVFHVPGDFASLPAALAAVPPGAVIVVHGGNHLPVTITKPVTIVGSPLATIENTGVSDPGNPFKIADAIRLSGSGTGRVTLGNLRTQGSADGGTYSSSGAGIAGSGFAELHLSDCDIQPAQWSGLTGQAQGADAIDVGVLYVLAERCTITGGLSDTDDCDYPSNPSGGAGICVTDGTVAVLDSTVTGGRGPIMCFSQGNCPSLPLPASDGGPGIITGTLMRAASTIVGGAGQPVTCGPVVLGTEADGPAIVASSVTDLGTALSASGSGVLGGSWTLAWDTTPGPAILVVGLPTVAPVAVGSKGMLFLDPDALLLLAVSGGMGQVISGTLPATPSLAGQEFGVHVYDAVVQKLTRPVVVVMQP